MKAGSGLMQAWAAASERERAELMAGQWALSLGIWIDVLQRRYFNVDAPGAATFTDWVVVHSTEGEPRLAVAVVAGEVHLKTVKGAAWSQHPPDLRSGDLNAKGAEAFDGGKDLVHGGIAAQRDGTVNAQPSTAEVGA